jgi:DNA-binding transcriptional MerR regulator
MFLAYAGIVKDSREKPLSLEELAAEAGVPARTIRFYIARGLLPRPAGAGRGAAYGSEHVARLRSVKRLQGKGLMLAEISRVLGGEKPEAGLPPPSAWWSYPLADAVVVWVRAGLSPWRTRQVRAALEEMAARLNAISREEDKEDGDR